MEDLDVVRGRLVVLGRDADRDEARDRASGDPGGERGQGRGGRERAGAGLRCASSAPPEHPATRSASSATNHREGIADRIGGGTTGPFDRAQAEPV